MRQDRIIVWDGAKAVGIWDEVGWTSLTGSQVAPDSASAFTAATGWMFRCMTIYANAVASIPLDLLDSRGKVIDSTDDWQNKLGFLPSPELFFWLVAAAQGLSGSAYLYQSKNAGGVVKILRPLAPASVVWDASKQKFSRASNPPADYPPTLDAQGNYSKAPETIAPIWMPDPDVEWGAPLKYPGKAASSAAGVQFNMDAAVAAFFARGMIGVKAFSIPPGTQPADKERFEEKVQRVTNGIRNAFRTLFLEAGKVEVIDLGGNIDGLKDQGLTQENREAMAAAWGIPMTKLLSSDASGLGGGGVAKADDLRLYTDTAIPAMNNILREFNKAILEPLGYELVERHGRLEIFQETEASRIGSWSASVDVILKDPEVALMVAPAWGITIPDDIRAKLEAYIAAKQPAPQPAPVLAAPVQSPDLLDLEEIVSSELVKWAAFERNRKGKGRAFECRHVPPRMEMRIRSALKAGVDIDTVFSQAGGDVPALVLADAINRAVEHGKAID